MARLRFLRGEKNPESLFLSHLKWIETTAKTVARRHGFGSEDAEDFCSHIKTKLLEDNYSVLRKFQNRSSFQLYLKTVIHRFCIDYRIAQEGKWRPSSTAQKMGQIAVQLEELLQLKHHSFEEAYEILSARHGSSLNRKELQEIALKFPKRWGKTTVQFVPLDPFSQSDPVSEKDPPDPREVERTQLFAKVLNEAMDQLSGSDRLLLKMRFQDSFTFEEIARFVKKEKMQVYGRLKKVLADLRQVLLEAGLAQSDIPEILGQAGKNIDLDFSIIRDTNEH